MTTRTRRRALALVVTLVVVSGGCLTVGPSVTANTGGSEVFESVSVSDPWTGQQVQATARLGPGGGGVTHLIVIGSKGGSVSKTAVDPGQTSVTVTLPATGNATIVASDSVNGTTVATLNVTADGRTFP